MATTDTTVRSTRLVFCALAVAASAFTNASPGAAQKKNYEEYYRAPNSVQGKTVVLPMGTTFEGRIDTSIGSAKSRAGQTFTISVSAPVLANGTDVIIPIGSQILGEIVEAIPSDHVPRAKGYPKPNGKLRVQLTQLRTPEGVTYPLVASIAGESLSMGNGGGQGRVNQNIGPTVAYVGSQTSFEAVAPGMADRNRSYNQAPKVVTRQQMMSDPILGTGNQQNNNGGQEKQQIRSLVHHGHELMIMSGSPLTVKIDEPFKIGIAPPRSAIDVLNVPAESNMTGGRRFAPSSSSSGSSSSAAGAGTAGGDANVNSGPSNPLPGILPDTPHGQTTTPMSTSQPPPGSLPGPGNQGGGNSF